MQALRFQMWGFPVWKRPRLHSDGSVLRGPSPRAFAGHGHGVGLTSPESVRPYVKAQKNDDRDAEGIAEAATRPASEATDIHRKLLIHGAGGALPHVVGPDTPRG